MGEISKLKIGILGTGRMAAVMAGAVQKMRNEEIVAVASRTMEKAEKFAVRFQIPRAYGSYEEMLRDPAVDLVYIATPHSHHEVHGLLCVDAEKPMLVEKSFTANAEQAERLIRAAREKKVFLAEAIWTRYMPIVKRMQEELASGKIGKVCSACANLGYYTMDNPRVMAPELAGGALLDVGIYALTFFSILFGDDVRSIVADARMSEGRIDLEDQGIITLASPLYGDVKCSFYASVTGPTDRRGIIYGSEGYMEVGNVNNYGYIEIYDASHRLKERIDCPAQTETGYVYQFEACRKALSEGKTEVEEMPHGEILTMMRIMDRIRKTMGVRYPFE